MRLHGVVLCWEKSTGTTLLLPIYLCMYECIQMKLEYDHEQRAEKDLEEAVLAHLKVVSGYSREETENSNTTRLSGQPVT
jgi:hypothetical protein